MPENLHRKRETIAQLRAMADELEADLPSDGNGNGDDEVAQARTARERARRLGWGGLIRGSGAAVAMLAIGRWLQERTLLAAALLAGGAAAGGVALAPAVAPHIPGMPVLAGPGPEQTVTRTVSRPVPPPATRTVTATPQASPSLAPDGTPSPTASPSSPVAPSPSVRATSAATQTTEPPAMSRPPKPPGNGGGLDGDDGGAVAEPPATTQPEPPTAKDDGTSCLIGVAVPPILAVCVLGDDV